MQKLNRKLLDDTHSECKKVDTRMISVKIQATGAAFV